MLPDVTAREHWESVYRSKEPTEVSWYAPHLNESLRMIQDAAGLTARIIDVGAGASTLVDDLLDLGYRDLTVLDISDAALGAARARLGDRAARVTWIVSEVTAAKLGKSSFDLWHDRAVFHFLTDEMDRRAYVQSLRHSLAPNGSVVMSTFSLAGPTTCSGLPVVRYDVEGIGRELGADFELARQVEVTHTTPSAREQRFLVCRFKKRA